MRYPINVETYIRALRLEFGLSEAAEEAHREIIPLINRCYEGGLHGEGGYPLDLDEERRDLAEATGKDLDHIKETPLIPPLIAWCNRAYEQGRKEVEGREDSV